jgi:hypothetical protein
VPVTCQVPSRLRTTYVSLPGEERPRRRRHRRTTDARGPIRPGRGRRQADPRLVGRSGSAGARRTRRRRVRATDARSRPRLPGQARARRRRSRGTGDARPPRNRAAIERPPSSRQRRRRRGERPPSSRRQRKRRAGRGPERPRVDHTVALGRAGARESDGSPPHLGPSPRSDDRGRRQSLRPRRLSEPRDRRSRLSGGDAGVCPGGCRTAGDQIHHPLAPRNVGELERELETGPGRHEGLPLFPCPCQRVRVAATRRLLLGSASSREIPPFARTLRCRQEREFGRFLVRSKLSGWSPSMSRARKIALAVAAALAAMSVLAATATLTLDRGRERTEATSAPASGATNVDSSRVETSSPAGGASSNAGSPTTLQAETTAPSPSEASTTTREPEARRQKRRPRNPHVQRSPTFGLDQDAARMEAFSEGSQTRAPPAAAE